MKALLLDAVAISEEPKYPRMNNDNTILLICNSSEKAAKISVILTFGGALSIGHPIRLDGTCARG